MKILLTLGLLALAGMAQADTLTLYNVSFCGRNISGRCTVYEDSFDKLSLYWNVDGHVTVTDYDALTGLVIDVYATNLFRDPRLGLDHEVLTGTTGNIALSGSLTSYRCLNRSGHNYWTWCTKFTNGVLDR